MSRTKGKLTNCNHFTIFTATKNEIIKIHNNGGINRFTAATRLYRGNPITVAVNRSLFKKNKKRNFHNTD